jgi:DNA-binding GntR family transcriptional regulator
VSKDTDIIDQLRLQLTYGMYAHGQRLKPEELRAEFGCSASTLREVLFRLSTEGLVDFRDQRGFRVPERAPETLHELTHLRILLESEGATLSVQHGGIGWEAQLTATHHKLSHIETRLNAEKGAPGPNPTSLVPLWSDAELEFHQTLISACGSEVLKRTHAMIYNRFRQQLITAENQFGYLPQNLHEHKAILDAALARDPKRLSEAIHAHLRRNLKREPALQTA